MDGVIRKSLKQGDFKFSSKSNNTILIERKSANDLYSSIMSGRVNKQLTRCLDETPYTYLLIEGKIRELHGFVCNGLGHKSRYPYTALSNLLVTLQNNGVKLLLSPNIETSASVVVALYSYYQKATHTGMSKAKKVATATDNRSKQLAFLMSLPGIGAKIAEEILSIYTCPADAIANNFNGIKGIGPAKLAEIIRLLHERTPGS
jgi:ERCC4-type nuclease